MGLRRRVCVRRLVGQGVGDRGAERVDPLLRRAPLRRGMEDELLVAMAPQYLPQAIASMDAISRNGLRYPIPNYGLQSDARAGLGYSYE